MNGARSNQNVLETVEREQETRMDRRKVQIIGG